MRWDLSVVEASRTQQDCVLTLKSSLHSMHIAKWFADLYRCAVEMKTKHYQRGGGGSENTFSVKFWKVNETTKYGKVVPDGRNILEEFHLITFMQDVLIWMTYINCILKLTVLPTEANTKLPGAGKGLGVFTSSASTVCVEQTVFLLFSWGKAIVYQDILQEHIHFESSLKAIYPPGSSVLCPLSYHDKSHLPCPTWYVGWPGPNALKISVMNWERKKIHRKTWRFNSYNPIHIQQAPSALDPR